MTCALASCVDETGVAPVHRGQRPAQSIGIVRNQNKMDMIGHQAPCPYLYLRRAAVFGQQVAVKRIVLVGEKRARAAIAAVVGLCAGEALADLPSVILGAVGLLVISAVGALALARSGRASTAGIAGLLAIAAMTAGDV